LKGVILAAGSGRRLSFHNGWRPKLLLPVAGRAIIDYTLEAFCRVGITDLTIVIGYRGDVLKGWVGDGSQKGLRIQYVYNPDYQLGNALSLYAARSLMENEPFLLSMADHMISPSLLARLLGIQESANALAVDFTSSSSQIEEATRVLVSDDGLVTHIGKELLPWNGIDAGAFRLTPVIFEAISDILGEKRAEYELSRAITCMIDRGHPLLACDISGCFWQDIDTREDLNLVRKTLTGTGL
jgi:choline kinase